VAGACGCVTADDCAAGEACQQGHCAGWPFADMLLGTNGGQFVLPNGDPVDFRGAISCCGGGYGWPVFDEAWVDYVASYAVTFLHVRLGPFLTGAGGESEWAAYGGGYVDVGGKADLTRFNDAFWNRVREVLKYAGDHGMWVEVDIADAWAVKHCRWGDVPGYSAWDSDNNVQHQDLCAAAGSRAITAGEVYDLWVRKVVYETGRYGNVIYQDGNELGLLDNYDDQWSLSIRDIVHDEEANNGYLHHLVGTNSESDSLIQESGIDYGEFHRESPVDSSRCHGKPCGVNEYNPEPPFTPQQIHDAFCAAKSAGTYVWYWRHGQSASQMDQTLSLIQQGCN